MDDKRRTEPKFRDEELQEAVDRIQIFWERYGSTVMIFITVFFVSIAAYTFFTKNAANRHEDAWSSLAGSGSPVSYKNLAAETSNPTVRVLAQLRAGDAYLAEGSVPPAGEITQEDLNQKLDDAAAAYSNVMSLSKDPAFTANAQLGLAAVAESQSDWEAAKGYYEQAIKIADAGKLPAVKKQADARIALLSTIESQIEFAPEPELPPATVKPEAAAPTAESAPAEAAPVAAPAETPAPAEAQ